MLTQDVFSRNQDVGSGGAATVISTNVIDTGDEGNLSYGAGYPVFVKGIVGTPFAGGTSVQPILKHADTEGGSYTALVTPDAILTADLGKEATFRINLPDTHKRFLRVDYVVVGTMSAGTISAGLTAAR